MFQENSIYCCNCESLASCLAEEVVNLILTSPPYANQRKKQYGGIDEQAYPAWTVQWAEKFKHTLKKDGSLAIVIRPHVHNGQVSDYVLKTRLAMREADWIECDELIWIKPCSPPLGHKFRPRRAWESILWFSRSRSPFCDPKANGTPSNRIGFESVKGVGEYKFGTNVPVEGIARCRDYVEVGTNFVDKSAENTHPAQYPEKLASWIIRLLCPPDGLVLDPFMGSGTTAIACLNNGNRFIGSEINADYHRIALNRIAKFHENKFSQVQDNKGLEKTPP